MLVEYLPKYHHRDINCLLNFFKLPLRISYKFYKLENEKWNCIISTTSENEIFFWYSEFKEKLFVSCTY